MTPQEKVSEYRLIAPITVTPPPRSSGGSFIIISRYQTFLFFPTISFSLTLPLDRFLLAITSLLSDATNS